MRRFRTLPLCLGALAFVAVSFAPAAVARDDREAKLRAQPQRLVVTVSASMKFDQDVYTLSKPGKVRIVLRGVNGMAITLAERPQVELATPGPPHSAVVRLPRGTYHLQSVIPGHTAAGIDALLVVG